MAYTGWRTYDFISAQVPGESYMLPLFFLFAAEAGMGLWHEISISHTTTYTQHQIATTLTWLDFAGSFGAGLADMIIRQTMIDYEMPVMLATVLIFGLPALVATNVAGALVYLQNDADDVEKRERRFLSFESHKQAIEALKNNRDKLAKDRKAEIYRAIAGTDLPAQVKSAVKYAGTNGHGTPQENEDLAEVLANPTKPRRRPPTVS
jgi:hypothetical protein